MAELDVERVLSELTNDEKVALLSGIDFWHTTPIPRLGIPSIRTSDGPNGIRGTHFFNGVSAACFPCGTAFGATWDPPLLRQAGILMGQEARLKGAAVVLGPTVNMQRSPLGGRGFESFSEDPVLSGLCAAAIIAGIQEQGLLATIKHFVANDQEHERAAVDVKVSERALREIYLLPFQIAVRDASPAAFMTAYNKINGLHVSENPKFLQEILRQDWGWEGLIMSDWYGTYSTSAAVNAGLDLEMPGPSRQRGSRLSHALAANKVKYHVLDQRVRTVLSFIKRAMASEIPEQAEEKAGDTPQTSEFLLKVAAESIVLMKNEKSVLPLSCERTTAVIGPNAKVALFSGGGSASLRPYYSVTPYEAVLAHMGIENTKYSLGASSHKELPLLGTHLRTLSGENGVTFRAFIEPPSVEVRGAVDEVRLETTSLFFADYYHPSIREDLWWAEVEGIFTPDQDGDYDFGLTVYGTAKLFIEGHLVIDNDTKQQPGDSFFGSGTIEEIGTTNLKSGKDYLLRVLFASAPTSKLSRPGETSFRGGGLRLGGVRKFSEEVEIQAAVQLAAQVDQVVICAGLNAEWETEGCDRAHMSLPGRSDELISAVAKANANTVVVIQSGTPVEMPWVDEVPAIVQAWYGGNECGNAIADVLVGAVNPSGKLPISFPIRNEDNPAFLNFRSEGGRVLYGEDVYIGYRFYDTIGRDVAFPFGHGLSYTTFLISDLRVDRTGETLEISIRIQNSGHKAGAETVQVYVRQALPAIRRPRKELKGFRKVFLEAGASTFLNISISTRYATSYWDETRSMWVSEKDTYTVYVGTSSANIVAKSSFSTSATYWWTGV